ncbi:MAG: hypothetical protein OQJ98_01105 [Candidatus Pacebacteria bacterium]|nr:hypothetical protein [Candidatus Paceibacterota bacterium]
MPEGIFLNNKKYFSSRDAASYAGYTNDYVSRLCREGKVPGQMMGRVWHVEAEPFLEFILGQEQKKVEQSQALSEGRKKTYQKSVEEDEIEKLTSLSIPRVALPVPAISRELIEKSVALSFAVFLVFGSYLAKDSEFVRATPAAIVSYATEVRNNTLGMVEGVREGVELSSVQTRSLISSVASGAYTDEIKEQFSLKNISLAASNFGGRILDVIERGMKGYLSLVVLAGEGVVSVSDAIAKLPVVAREASVADIVAYSTQKVQDVAASTSGGLGNAREYFLVSIARGVDGAKQIFQNSHTTLAAVNVPDFFGSLSSSIRFGIIDWLDIQSEGVVTTPSFVEEPQAVIEHPVIERVVETRETIVRSGITEEYVLAKLEELNNKLSSKIYDLTASNASSIASNFNTIAKTNIINKLKSVTITSSTITDSTINGNSTFSGTTGSFSGAVDVGSLTVGGEVITGGLTVGTDGIVFVSSSGNVGIGTTSPYAKLSVVGEVVAANFTATSTSATSTFNGALLATRAPTLPHTFSVWSPGASGSNYADASLVINPASSVADGNLITASVGGSVKFIVDAEGGVFTNSLTSVGGVTLSTTTAATFTVEGNTTLGDSVSDVTTINGTLTVTGQTSVSTVDGNFGVGTTSPWARLSVAGVSNGTDPLFTISTSTASATSTAVLVDANGNFGIGTTSPSATFAVEGDAYINGVITTDLTTSGIVDFSGTGTTTFGGDIEVQGLSAINYLETPFIYATSTTATSTFAGGLAIETTGLVYDYSTNRVGIGTASPSQSLDVYGKIAQNGLQMLYNANAGGYTGSLFFGSGGGSLSHTSGSEGYYNTAVGYDTLLSNTTGSYNSALGYKALYSNTTGDSNTAVGKDALRYNTTGFQNTAIGLDALQANTEGYNNSALGFDALYSNTTGYTNIAVGMSALYRNTEGFDNVAVGYEALHDNTIGDGSVALGLGALYNNTTGGWNVALGPHAGRYVTGSVANESSEYSVYIGANTKGFADGDSNEIVIGYNATGIGSNTVTLGNDSIVTTALKGNVGIGTTTPWGKLSIEMDTTDPSFVVSNQGSSTPALYVSGVNQDGVVGIGTTGGTGRRLDVFDAGNPQLRLSQTSSIYTNFQVAASTGDLTIDLNPNTSATNIYLTQTGGSTGANLRVCEGSACPSVTISSGGNVLAENGFYFGNGYKLDQVAGTTTEIAVYDTSATAIIIFDEF